MPSLEGQVALVTGGSYGVGGGIARVLAEAGVRTFVTGRSIGGDGGPGAGIIGVKCDHRVDAEVAAAFERVARQAGSVDILVNNVWGGYEQMVVNGEFTWSKPFWEQPLWRWDAMFTAGVRSHYHASQLAAPVMIARGRAPDAHGRILRCALTARCESPRHHSAVGRRRVGARSPARVS